MAQQAQIKAGDKIRILEDGLNYASVKKGDILIVEAVCDKEPGNNPYLVAADGWGFFLSALGSGFEIVGAEKEESLDGHYDFFYELTPWEAQFLQVKLDPYKVSSVWKLGEKDNTGCIFHILKTIARFGEKNDKEREIKAMHATIKRLAEIEGVDLDE